MGAICVIGPSILHRHKAKRINSEEFVKVLEEELKPVISKMQEQQREIKWRVIQDNAPIHNSKFTKKYLESSEINTIKWPPVSPHLNIIKNAWGWLTRKVYQDGKSYANLEDLWTGIQNAWSKIPEDYIQKLVDSMHDCL